MNAKSGITTIIALVVGLVIGYLVWGTGDTTEVAVQDSESGGGRVETVNIKMASAFNATLPVVGPGAVYLTELIDEISGGELKFKFFDPGKLVPALEVFDAVSSGAVGAGFSTAGFWMGKMPAASIFSSIPFGPDSMEFLSWLFQGEGLELYQELYARRDVWVYPCGMIPPEASGWFREEITSPDQFKGMKIRFFGIGGMAMQKLGASVQLLAPGDIYPALERGVIDATELSMPVIDERLGFYKVAKHYYFPGWHQQSTATELLIHMDVWNKLIPRHQRIIETACKDVTLRNITIGETVQGEALEKIRAAGVQIHYWDNEFLDLFKKVTDETLAELSAKDPDFKRYLDSLNKFRGEFKEWARLSRLPPGY